MAEPGITEEYLADAEVFRITVTMPKQTLLTFPEGAQNSWQNMVWDECLRRAHAQDLMPMGAVLVGDPEEVDPDVGQIAPLPPVTSVDGVEFRASGRARVDPEAFMEGFRGAPIAPIAVTMVRVIAEVPVRAFGL